MNPKRTYSEDEVLHALESIKSNGGNVSKASRELGIPRLTLLQWNSGRRRALAVGRNEDLEAEGSAASAGSDPVLSAHAREMNLKKVHITKAWTVVTLQALEKLKELIPSSRNVRDLSILAGVGTDKLVALSGGTRSTSDVNVTVTLADAYRRTITVHKVDVPAGEGRDRP